MAIRRRERRVIGPDPSAHHEHSGKGHKIHVPEPHSAHPKAHQSSPYSYYGRTYDTHPQERLHVGHHPGGPGLRRGGLVTSVRRHGLESWLKRGGGHGASYKD